ncbi:MAG: hypothetical protein M3T56_11870 [Chloroflexota bacterium]|nr:hypothetical protein [Chloroflexota bacterium]
MIAYKFLSSGALGFFSGYTWPTPAADRPGDWVRASGELRQCQNGIHACTETQLVEWLDEELWEIELDGTAVDVESGLVAQAGRLIRRLEGWDEKCARAFVDHCADTTVALAAESLVLTGRKRDSEELSAARAGPQAEEKLRALARSFEDEPSSPIIFLDDVMRLKRGGRPESEERAPAEDSGGPTPFALAANLGFVCAHVAAQLAEQANPGTYNDTFGRERLSQSTWLAEQLRLQG